MGMKNSTIQKRAIARALKSAKALAADLAKVEATVPAARSLPTIIAQLEALQGLKTCTCATCTYAPLDSHHY